MKEDSRVGVGAVGGLAVGMVVGSIVLVNLTAMRLEMLETSFVLIVMLLGEPDPDFAETAD